MKIRGNLLKYVEIRTVNSSVDVDAVGAKHY